MTDGPVLGQIGRMSKKQTLKIEIVGELKPNEWDEFAACLKECAKRFPGKIRVIYKRYRVSIKKAVRNKR
jgi:hypothetical protein